MASGSHHGGSKHHGSYFFKSGSSSHSSHSSSSSSGHNSSGSSSHGIYDEATKRKARLIIDVLGLLVTILVIGVALYNRYPIVYPVAFELVVLGIIMCLNETYNPIGKMEGVEKFKNEFSREVYFFYNHSGSHKALPNKQHPIVDGKSWCSEKYYYLYFKDDEEVIKKIYYFLHTQPFIIFIEPYMLLFFAIGFAILGIFSYAFVIPLFENMVMSDEAFSIVDALVFLFPFMLTFACGLICKLSNLIFHRRMRTLCEGIIKEKKARRAIELHKQKINKRQENTWYYNTCPSCGIVNDDRATACSNCGVSLRITDEEFDVTNAHQVKDITTVSEAKEIED